MGGLSLIGVEWLDVAKGLSGFLSGTGGLMKSSDKQEQARLAAELAEKQRREDERRKAEQDAANRNLLIGIGATAAGALGLAYILKR